MIGEGGTRRVRGILTVFAGPMFAGKSAHLLSDYPEDAATLCLAPAFDTRSGAQIKSRVGLSRAARSVSSWPEDFAAYRHILLDEGHFMIAPHYEGDVVRDIERALDKGVNVTVAGLDTDYRREAFVVMDRLRALADHYVSLTARCHHCGAPASWTAKKHPTGHLLETGDEDLYEARCNAHWQSPD
ncbi:MULTISPECIES: thymidine kinase [unclassified Asaia]|uniref:thymidine kinase n=1 Tax=unclassified Asaia TaxID=2685023 RepID=UPI0026B81E23